VEKYCRDGQVTDGKEAHAHCMLDTKRYRYIIRKCDTYSFCTATVTERKCLNVTLYVHFMSSLCTMCLINSIQN